MASHIGKLPVTVPAGVEVKIEGQNFSVKGAKGSDSYVIPEGITAAVEGNEIVLTPADDQRTTRAMHGLSRSIIAGMVKGVHEGYTKTLDIVGTGYRAVCRHRVRTAEPQPGDRQGHRQAGCGSGCCEYPQAARSGTLQGQGCQVHRRAHSAQGWKGW